MVVRLRYLPWLFKLFFFFSDIHGPSRMNPNETLYWSLNFSSSATMKLTFVVYFPIQTLLFPFSLKHALSMTWHFVITGCMHPERGWRSTFKHYLDEEHFCSLTHGFLSVMINNEDNSHDVLCWLRGPSQNALHTVHFTHKPGPVPLMDSQGSYLLDRVLSSVIVPD